MGPSISRIPQSPSPKPAHTRTPKPVESKFDQDFDRFMNGLENFEPFDDLEDWSGNIELFMDAMASPPKQSSDSIYDKPWIKEPEGLTPTQSWLHWMNENALCVEMGLPLPAHPKHTYSKIGGLTDSDSECSSDPEDELDDII